MFLLSLLINLMDPCWIKYVFILCLRLKDSIVNTKLLQYLQWLYCTTSLLSYTQTHTLAHALALDLPTFLHPFFSFHADHLSPPFFPTNTIPLFLHLHTRLRAHTGNSAGNLTEEKRLQYNEGITHRVWTFIHARTHTTVPAYTCKHTQTCQHTHRYTHKYTSSAAAISWPVLRSGRPRIPPLLSGEWHFVSTGTQAYIFLILYHAQPANMFWPFMETEGKHTP